MSIAWVRKSYSVPAKRGGRVIYTGDGRPKSGTITGTAGHRLRIRLDGDRRSGRYHPTWEIRYLDAEASQ